MHIVPYAIAFGALALVIVVILLLSISGTWRNIRRKLRWAEKRHVEPTAFIDLVGLYRPETMRFEVIDDVGDTIHSRPGEYAASFEVLINRRLVRYATSVDASVIPPDHVRTSWMMICKKRGIRHSEWHSYSDIGRIYGRLADNARMTRYAGPAIAFFDSRFRGYVENPADVISTAWDEVAEKPAQASEVA